MPSHIVKDTGSRYGNDVQIDAGDGDVLSLVTGGGTYKDILNYNFTVISEKMRDLQFSWQTLSPGSVIQYDVSIGPNAVMENPSIGDEIQDLTNVQDGQTGTLLIAGGPNSPDWHVSWDFGNPGTPVVTADAGKYSVINWIRKGSSTLAILAGSSSADASIGLKRRSRIAAGRPYLNILSPEDADTVGVRRLHLHTFSDVGE